MMGNETVYKVTAYLTRFNNGKQQLLVFKEIEFEHLGLQVPGGTVEKNEDLLDALKREVKEESGITDLLNINLLGEYSYNSDKLKRNVKRFYYQMEAICFENFTHIVQSNDEDNGWIYNYFWIDLEEKPTLFGYLGVHLDKIRQ
jgi:8-oxo-dGTP pyrophosphatase MutT (NUDIX family)